MINKGNGFIILYFEGKAPKEVAKEHKNYYQSIKFN